MRFHTFLLKYGEIGIKGKNRYLFEDALVRQVKRALTDVDGEFKVYKSQARIYVDCVGEYDYEETVEHLSVFGLVGICPVVRMEDRGFDQLKKDVVAYMDEVYPDKNLTFKVEARRAEEILPEDLHGDQLRSGRGHSGSISPDPGRRASPGRDAPCGDPQ